MANDWGVKKENEDGSVQWVMVQEPLELTEPNETDGCIDNLSEDSAETMAGEIGEGFAPGRPIRRPHNT